MLDKTQITYDRYYDTVCHRMGCWTKEYHHQIKNCWDHSVEPQQAAEAIKHHGGVFAVDE